MDGGSCRGRRRRDHRTVRSHDGAQLTDAMNRYGEVDGSPLSYDTRGGVRG